MSTPTANTESLPPSHFAALGSPHCSMWGKSEIEWMAHDYVSALAANGDSWEPITPEQVLALAPRPHYAGLWKSDHYSHWVEMVIRQLRDAEGAAEVWRLDFSTLARLAGVKA